MHMPSLPQLVKSDLILKNNGRPLYLRSVRPIRPTNRAVLFLHGSTLPGLVFDIPITNQSWQEQLAIQGFSTYALDHIGFGKSYKPTTDTQQPISRASEAYKDAFQAITAIRAEGMMDLTIIGSSWGSLVAGKLLSAHPFSIDRLVLYAPIYNEVNHSWINSLQGENKQIKAIFQSPYRTTTAEALISRWNSDIPIIDKSEWRDDSITQFLLSRTISNNQNSFSTPNGPFHDLLSAFSGTALYDASHIQVPLYIVRPEADTTSQNGDALAIYQQANSSNKSYDILPNGSHFMFLEKNAPKLFDKVRDFIC